MTLEWRLVSGNQVLLRIPIQEHVQGSGQGSRLDDSHLERLVDLLSVAANPRRFRMMSEMISRGEMQFSDLLDLAENPKLVADCMGPLVEEGMVSHEGRGSSYKPTRAGYAFAATVTTAIPLLLEFLEENEEGEEEEGDELE